MTAVEPGRRVTFRDVLGNREFRAVFYAHALSVSGDQLAKIAVQQRDNACANPDAIFHGQPITIDDVLSSPVIVDPLHMLEIVMPVGGEISPNVRRFVGISESVAEADTSSVAYGLIV